jgi:hypothetical protein
MSTFATEKNARCSDNFLATAQKMSDIKEKVDLTWQQALQQFNLESSKR